QMDRSTEQIWYKGAPDERHHVVPLTNVYDWYNNHMILHSARLSFDEGKTWDSIVELRRRNGPTFPFIAKSETVEAESGWGGIAAARRMLSMERAEVERLERARNELQRQVDEQERMLEKMKELEKQLDQLNLKRAENYSQIEGRMCTVAGRLTAETRAAVQKARAHPQPVVAAADDEEDYDSDPNEASLMFNEKDLFVDNGDGRIATREGPVEKPPTIAVGPLCIYPMLQASSLPDDYPVHSAILASLRAQLREGVDPAVAAATAAMFVPPPKCSLCSGARPLTTLTAFLEHVVDQQHIGKVTATGGVISATQVFYWKGILSGGPVNGQTV
ncbi:hypothetical protein PRIPAC_89165, partial [Pristionchus pacificus]